nr:lymphocyte antigen 6 complex locus protein G5c [Loxodonta africana]
MHFMAGCAGSRSLGLLGLRSTSQGLCMVLLLVLVMKSLVFGGLGPCPWTSLSLAPVAPPPGSSTDIMVSDCRRKEQMSDCSYTRTSPVFGFWIYSRCCFLDFCNDPQSRAIYNP